MLLIQDILTVDSPVRDENHDVPEAVVAPDAFAEHTHHQPNETYAVFSGMPDATSARNEPNASPH
jgi:hypothetical protein